MQQRHAMEVRDLEMRQYEESVVQQERRRQEMQILREKHAEELKQSRTPRENEYVRRRDELQRRHAREANEHNDGVFPCVMVGDGDDEVDYRDWSQREMWCRHDAEMRRLREQFPDVKVNTL
jgi:hypothetical protein